MTQPVELTVKGHLQENGLVFVTLPAGQYMIAEKPFTFSGYGGEKAIIDLAHIENVWRSNTINAIEKYLNQDTKDTITITEYETRKNELLSKRRAIADGFDDDDGPTYEWETIQDRHNYELFGVLYRAITYPITTLSHVKIVVEGEAPIEHPTIIPIRKLTGDLTNTLYQYNRNGHAAGLVRSLLLRAGWRELDTEPAICGRPKDCNNTFFMKNGSLEFSKIFTPQTDTYICITMPQLKPFEKIGASRSGTFAELKALYDLTENEIRSIVGAFVNRNESLNSMPAATIGKCLSSLSQLQQKIREIESMKKTQSSHSQALKMVNELVKTFSEAASDGI